jgi:hypothetical protein
LNNKIKKSNISLNDHTIKSILPSNTQNVEILNNKILNNSHTSLNNDMPSTNSDNRIDLLNSNIDKRFYNYYFNSDSKNQNEQRTKSGRQIYNLTREDKEEFKKKFDPDLYFK